MKKDKLIDMIVSAQGSTFSIIVGHTFHGKQEVAELIPLAGLLANSMVLPDPFATQGVNCVGVSS